MVFDPKTLKSQIEAALVRISTMTDGAKLRQQHANIHKLADLDDLDRERLDDAVLQRIKVACPRIAKELLGPRDAQGRIFLETFYAELSAQFDLSGNQLRNGVKTGGYMINGTRYVEVYISYKTAEGINVGLAWIQEGPSDAPYIEFSKRHVRGNGGEADQFTRFADKESAKAAYVATLKSLIGPQ